MEQQLVEQAKSSGFNVYQNAWGQWVIRGVIDKKMWVLREQSSNSWLITYDELSPMSLCTEKSLLVLDMFIKHTTY